MPFFPSHESAVFEMSCAKVAATTGGEGEDNKLLPEMLVKYGPGPLRSKSWRAGHRSPVLPYTSET